ncbi:MAG: hypothetical protein IJA60_06430 [Clostridia bacterium]|nr:hypothetical protein [Clostridia bacterium]
MIIEVVQTASDVKQLYDVYYDKTLVYQGKLGFMNRWQDIELCKGEGTVMSATYILSKWTYCIPFLSWFGKKQKRSIFRLTQGENPVAVFAHELHGFLKKLKSAFR